MDVVEHLQGRLQELAKRMETIEKKRRTLDDDRADVEELYRATEVVLKAELKARGLGDTEEASWAAIKSKLRTMTLKDAIYTVVSTQGEEGIHLNAILEKLKEADFPLKSKTPKKSIVGTIYLEINKHGTYERVAPNTFKVVKAGKAAVQGELVRIEDD